MWIARESLVAFSIYLKKELDEMMSSMLMMTMMISYCLFDFHLRDKLEGQAQQQQQEHVEDDDDDEVEDDYAENGWVMWVQMLNSQMSV